MNVRMAKISKKELDNCIKYEVWGANTDRNLNTWKEGDKLLLYTDGERKLAAVAEVIGKVYMDDLPVWENGLFPFRLPLKFIYTLQEKDMIPFDDKIVGMLRKEWGQSYGWAIIAKRPLSRETAEKLIGMISAKAD